MSRVAMAKLCLALTALILLGACSTSVSSPSAGAAAQIGRELASAIAAALSAGGLPCTNTSSRAGATYVADHAVCEIGADDVVIRTFSSTEDRDHFIDAAGSILGQMSFAVDAPPRVVGPTWIVTTDTQATADRIRAILGGELR